MIRITGGVSLIGLGLVTLIGGAIWLTVLLAFTGVVLIFQGVKDLAHENEEGG